MPRIGGKVCPEILSCLSTQSFLCITEDKGKTVVNLEILNQKLMQSMICESRNLTSIQGPRVPLQSYVARKKSA